MNKNSNKDEQKQKVRNGIEDVFAKYEPHEEVPDFPNIDEDSPKNKKRSEKSSKSLGKGLNALMPKRTSKEDKEKVPPKKYLRFHLKV